MESLEGYSYYDTPTGPQYVRNNNSVDGPSDGRRKPAGVKYHPYSGSRRPERSQPSTPTEVVNDSPVNDVLTHAQLKGYDESSIGTIDPHALFTPQASALDGLQTGSPKLGDIPMSQTRQIYHNATNDPQYYLEMLSKSTAMQMDMTRRAVSEPPFSHFQQALQYSDETMRNSPNLGLYPNFQAVQAVGAQSVPQVQSLRNEAQSWSQASVPNLLPKMQDPQCQSLPNYEMDMSVDDRSSVWTRSQLPPQDASIAARAGSANSTLSMNMSDLSSGHEQWHESRENYSATWPTSQDVPLNNTSGNYTHQSAWRPDQSVAGGLIDGSLFEYGPFYDQSESPQSLPVQGTTVDHRDHSTLATTYHRPRSIEEQERPVPQVELVGGYFAPEDDPALPMPPEVNSQGGIRISRLPAKKVPVVYEIPAIPDMTVNQLKTELKKRNLSAVGKKSELQARLAASTRDGLSIGDN